MSDLYKFLDELRAKISIAEVVGDKVKLVRKGREFTGLCPFHNEKTPSFTVNEAKGFYHCFGCGAHGDIVKFEMEANNLPFMEAVNKLANKAGLEVPQMSRENQAENEQKNSFYEIMEMAVKFFEKNLRLTGGVKALDYLYNRGFDDEIIAKFHLGYAPSNNGLKAQLLSKGVSESDMIELGLASISESGGRIFDFFRDRVIIPIFDKKGRPIAFGGRILGEGQPKYLNSPETPIFNKRRILYNLHNARDKAYEAKNLIICEGYMDVIALDKYGFANAVAPLGTALTEEQIIEAWRICPEPTLCFDGDNAGIRAATRSLERALPIIKAGYSLRYAFLPDKMDPDDFLKAKGKEEFVKVLNDFKPMADILWKKHIEEADPSTPEQKALLEKNVMEDVAKIADEKVRGYYLQAMKDKVFQEFGRGKTVQKTVRLKQNLASRKIRDDFVVSFVVAAMVCYPELIEKFEEKLAMFEVSTPKLKSLLENIIDFCQATENVNFDNLYDALVEKGCKNDLEALWELKMFKQQKAKNYDIALEIDRKIIEAQVKTLDFEIRECRRVIDASESFDDELFKKYESLTKEKLALLATNA